MDSISSSSVPVRPGARGSASGAGWPGAVAVSAIDAERLAFGHQPGDTLLAVLDGVTDLGGVLGRHVAHLRDNVEGALLEADDAVHELLDGIGADGGSVASAHGRLLDLAAHVRQHLDALGHALLHHL